MKVYVFALSGRGGGVSFADLLIHELSTLSPIFLRARDAEGVPTDDLNNTLKLIDVPHQLFTSSWFKLLFRTIPFLIRNIHPGSLCIFSMPHPLDSLFYSICKIRKCTVVSFIHDDKPHFGEKWPKSSTVKKRMKITDHAIFLSDYVASKMIYVKCEKVDVCSFPTRKTTTAASENFILFAGRMKKYQGLPTLLESWEIAKAFLPGYRLLIAGETDAEIPDDPSISVIRRWLSHEELEILISKSALLVLPYLEATQSGLFMQAASAGVPIVATPVGGLTEQVSNYPGSLLSHDITAGSIAEAIIEGVKLPRGEQFTNKNPRLIELLTIEYFSNHHKKE